MTRMDLIYCIASRHSWHKGRPVPVHSDQHAWRVLAEAMEYEEDPRKRRGYNMAQCRLSLNYHAWGHNHPDDNAPARLDAVSKYELPEWCVSSPFIHNPLT